jgi:hypothetical protein
MLLSRPFYRDYRRVLGRSGIAEVSTVNWHTAAFTMDVYAHLLKGQQRQAAEALDHLLA